MVGYEPPAIMVVHPNDFHRRITVETLHREGVMVSPQHHVTLNQLIRMLHVDMRLPQTLDNDAVNFVQLHQRCHEAAIRGKLPFMHIDGVGEWTMTKTKRLQRLHAELIDLREPFSWDGDPGAEVFDRLARQYELDAGGTLPALLPRHVLEALRGAEAPPFHLTEVDGLVMLDTAPDFTEIEQDLLAEVARWCPIHQLLNPGSFRLGFHGAYLLDEDPCTADTLPTWLPSHEPWVPTTNEWRTEVGEERQTQITRVTVDERHDIRHAALSLVESFLQTEQGRILIVDANAQASARVWSSDLASLGLALADTSVALNQQPLHHAVVGAAHLSTGLGAWSLESLRKVFFSSALPVLRQPFPNAAHPSRADWAPQPHADVLEDIASSFHVLGGPGAIARWMGVLGQAKPSITERYPERQAQRLEETQWWLASLLRIWRPLLSSEDVHLLGMDVVGCTSGDTLPMPESPPSPMAWLSWLITALDLNALQERRHPNDAGLGALQALVDGLKTLYNAAWPSDASPEVHRRWFHDILDLLGENTALSVSGSSTSSIHLVTPEEALGCEADLILLTGMDVDAWTMKSSSVPWLDANALLELGVFQTDALVRRGRHHLRHLLNAGRYVVVFDSTAEEGGGPSAPLAEWLGERHQSGTWDSMRSPPAFLPTSRFEGEQAQRVFQWKVREKGHGAWLTPQRYAWVSTDSGMRLVRQGHRGRDRRQQTGLDLHAGHAYDGEVNHAEGVLATFEGPIQADRIQRQPLAKDLSAGETMGWEERERLVSVDAVVVRPTVPALKTPAAAAPVWPHLGHRGEKGSPSVSVDPRPLPPYANTEFTFADRFGRIEHGTVRETWSPSRLEAWLACPRQAWAKQVLQADDDEAVGSEDIEPRVRGQVVHETEATLLQGHGLTVGEELVASRGPLHLGPMGQGAAGWQTILAYLAEEVPWLGRHNAISVHRTRDLVDASPEEWRSYLHGELDLPPRGRLARLLEADLALRQASPVAVEWAAAEGEQRSVWFPALDVEGGADEEHGFHMFGYADRVDVIEFTKEQNKALEDAGILGDTSHDTPYPLDGTRRTAQRLVIVRDLKTVNGPKPDDVSLRHKRSLFEDLQLALYARAWELLHPNDRVVGVGASEIGEFTTHYVELDSVLDVLPTLPEVGKLTAVFPTNFPSHLPDGSSISPFRHWLRARLEVAHRAVATAAAGHINPTPGSHCRYCPLTSSCAVSTADGGGF